MSTPDEANGFIQAARRIRLAGSCADVASALLRAVVPGSPLDSTEWRARSTVRSAAESRLRRLEVQLIQRSTTSPELAGDLRIETRKSLERILRPVSRLDAVDLFRYADMAVASIATLAGATDAVADAAAASNPDRTFAWLTLGGKLFVPARTADAARQAGLDDEALKSLLMSAAAPLVRACETPDTGRIGHLRVRRDHAGHGVSLRASLDGSTHHTPLIKIELTGLDQPDTAFEPGAIEPDENRFSARLLRVLVS